MNNKIPYTSWIIPESREQQDWVLRYLTRKNHPLLKAAPPGLGVVDHSSPSPLLEFIKTADPERLRSSYLDMSELELNEARRLMERAWRVHQIRDKKKKHSRVTIEATQTARTRLKSESKRTGKPIYELIEELTSDIKKYKAELKKDINEKAKNSKQKLKEQANKSARLLPDVKNNESKRIQLTEIIQDLSELMDDFESMNDGEFALVTTEKLNRLLKIIDKGVEITRQNNPLNFSRQPTEKTAQSPN